MNRQTTDRRLADILTELYPDAPTAQGVARRVGLDTERIDWGGALQDVWGRIVQYARSRNQLRALLAYAREDAPERDDLRELSVSEMGKTDRDWAMQDMGSYILDSLRQEMRAMEERLIRRIDDVDAKVDSLRAVSLMYTGKKRSAWLTGFILFSLPCMLFIKESRDLLGLQPPAAILVISLFWAIACVLFMYGMGLLRDL